MTLEQGEILVVTNMVPYFHEGTYDVRLLVQGSVILVVSSSMSWEYGENRAITYVTFVDPDGALSKLMTVDEKLHFRRLYR